MQARSSLTFQTLQIKNIKLHIVTDTKYRKHYWLRDYPQKAVPLVERLVARLRRLRRGFAGSLPFFLLT